MSAKPCPDCDSEVAGVDSLCFYHRGEVAKAGVTATEEALRCLMDHERGQAEAIRLLRAFIAKTKGETT